MPSVSEAHVSLVTPFTYWGSFSLSLFICIVFQLYRTIEYHNEATNATKLSKTEDNGERHRKFKAFQSNYLFVYIMAMLADWLQGPYIYELYVFYGFEEVEIAELFVMGFGSSMIAGTFIGSLADKYGRKSMCIVYSVCYIIACCTKLVPNYKLLMLGRFLSGISTSLLFSVFESWMICEHKNKGFSDIELRETFAYSTLGNGLMGVIGGLAANSAAAHFGFVAPFILAIFPLLIVAITVACTWSNNYGTGQGEGSSDSLFASLKGGFAFIKSNSRIAAIGLSQSLFEGGMYTFIFMWTPALHAAVHSVKTLDGSRLLGVITNRVLPAAKTNAVIMEMPLPVAEDVDYTSQYLGLIFAVFMLCSVVGSSLFQLFSSNKAMVAMIPLYLHGVAFLSMLIVSCTLHDKNVVYCMFLVFEVTVGLFYPSYGFLKSQIITEDFRSAVMNLFRIPLNIFVVALLVKINYLSFEAIFLICAAAHGLALVLYMYFYIWFTRSGKEQSVWVDDNDEESEGQGQG